MALRWCVILAALSGCSGPDDYRLCQPTPARLLAHAPRLLSETGLFDDLARETLSAGVMAFSPAFELWSDGATKRRWIRLPQHEVIDTRDADAWHFPTGTKLWKEFSLDGTRLETRLLQKVGPAASDWLPVAYVWDESQSEAHATPAGVSNALGTDHDVPASSQCMGCHGGTRSRVLGFSAVQLAAPSSGPDLDALVERGLLSDPPDELPVVPGNDSERRALGYLHANCAHCHNRRRPERSAPRCYDPQRRFDFSLRTAELASVEQTATYRTAIGEVVEPGDPEDSELLERVSSRSPDRYRPGMPPLGSERVDRDAVTLLRMWIEGL